MSRNKLGKGIPLNSQSREIISSIFDYMKTNDTPLMPGAVGLYERVSQATAVSVTTLRRIIKKRKREAQDEVSFPIPKNYWRLSKKRIEVSNYDKAAMRRSIYDYHVKHKKSLTIGFLLASVRKELNFSGSESCLRRVMKEMGFRWRKVMRRKQKDYFCILIEKSEIIYQRINYLSNIELCRQKNQPLVYISETHISHPTCKFANPLDAEEKSSNIMIVYGITNTGVILPNPLIILNTKKMPDLLTYENWLNDDLIPNLQPKSTIVIDAISYYSEISDPVPTSLAKRHEMIDWLTRKNISYNVNMLKPELFRLITINKPRTQEFKLDTILKRHGHDTLRLPNCHPELNPVEHISYKLKKFIEDSSFLINVQNVRRLFDESTSHIKPSEWQSMCTHVIEEEEKYKISDAFLDTITEEQEYGTNLGDTSSEESESELECMSEDSDLGE